MQLPRIDTAGQVTMEDDLRAELDNKLRRLLVEVAGIDPLVITDDATIDRDLEMNSVTFVEIQVALEEDLEVLVDPIVVVELNRFRDIVDYLSRLVAETRQ